MRACPYTGCPYPSRVQDDNYGGALCLSHYGNGVYGPTPAVLPPSALVPARKLACTPPRIATRAIVTSKYVDVCSRDYRRFPRVCTVVLRFFPRDGGYEGMWVASR